MIRLIGVTIAAGVLATIAAGFFDGNKASGGYYPDPSVPGTCIHPSGYPPDPCPVADSEYFIIQCSNKSIWHIPRRTVRGKTDLYGVVFDLSSVSKAGCNKFSIFDF